MNSCYIVYDHWINHSQKYTLDVLKCSKSLQNSTSFVLDTSRFFITFHSQLKTWSMNKKDKYIYMWLTVAQSTCRSALMEGWGKDDVTMVRWRWHDYATVRWRRCNGDEAMLYRAISLSTFLHMRCFIIKWRQDYFVFFSCYDLSITNQACCMPVLNAC